MNFEMRFQVEAVRIIFWKDKHQFVLFTKSENDILQSGASSFVRFGKYQLFGGNAGVFNCFLTFFYQIFFSDYI